MLKNKNIVCVAFPTWEGVYLKSTVQLMTELARQNNVLYVDYAFTFKDVFSGIRGKDVPYKRILGLEPRLRELPLGGGGHVHVLSLPPIVSVNWIKGENWYQRLSRISMPQVRRVIRRAMDQLGMTSPIVINAFNPFLGVHLLGKLNEQLHLYYCYDEIRAAEWAKNHGGRLEGQFASQVDGIIVSSDTLHTAKKRWNDKCFIVKNGVNFDLFSQKATSFPLEQYHHTHDKVIGYIGSVDQRLDYELLKACAQAYPHYAFVFVGRIKYKKGEKILRKSKNIFLLGPQPFDELHNFIQGFDVGLIPFLDNDFTSGIYPLKINEYLAAGKAVISTEFGDLDDFRRIITITPHQDTFVRSIKLVLENDSTAEQENRVEIASQNSWPARAEHFGAIINDLLKKTS